jgi:ketosteroid isomerase-like protein
MSGSIPSLEIEGEALREAYAALSRNDIEGFAAISDPEIERIEPDDFPGAGTYLGIEAVKAHISQGRSTWAEGGCEPAQMVLAGDKIVVLIKVRVRLKDHADWIEGSIGDVFTFRNGKAIQFRTFGEQQEALEWAEAEALEAS